MKNTDIESKIVEIDFLINNEDKLNEYINIIENTDILVNENIKQKLLKKIVVKKSNKISIYNILKIAACMIFSLAVWKVVDIGESNINISNKDYNTQEIYMNLENKFDEISAFMMSPKIFEGGEE